MCWVRLWGSGFGSLQGLYLNPGAPQNGGNLSGTPGTKGDCGLPVHDEAENLVRCFHNEGMHASILISLPGRVVLVLVDGFQSVAFCHSCLIAMQMLSIFPSAWQEATL